MKTNRRKIVILSTVAIFFVLSGLSFVSAENYDALKGVDSAKVMFDMRDGVPKIAAVHMKLILDTYKELAAMKKNPVFVVVFMGSSVKLISTNRSEFSSEEQKYMQEIEATISKMSRAGIQLEVCLAAAEYFGVDPTSIQSEIKQIGNGWISEIGYQTSGYSLVPVY
ncbi:MAG: DsrE family protein [Desulfobacterales bacterium]|jgi:intracellular sulfur oxidation DsrE/DsrF family protein